MAHICPFVCLLDMTKHTNTNYKRVHVPCLLNILFGFGKNQPFGFQLTIFNCQEIMVKCLFVLQDFPHPESHLSGPIRSLQLHQTNSNSTRSREQGSTSQKHQTPANSKLRYVLISTAIGSRRTISPQPVLL